MEETQEQKESQKTSSKKWIVIASVIIILAIAGVAYESQKKQSSVTMSASPTIMPTVSTIHYKDGTYTAEGDYITHVGSKHIAVKVTLKSNIITESDVTDEADDRMSVHFQDLFIANYKQSVIGKNIADIHLSKIAGSSLTPNGFNDALKKIELLAKS